MSSPLRIWAVAVVLSAVVAVLAVATAEKPEQAAAGAPSGSTLEGTWVDPDGNGVLERGPGEPIIERTELAPATETTRTLATLAQITDAHVRDEESPARAPLVDRLGEAGNSTFRPQEALTAQVLNAAVASLAALEPDAVLVTGDLIDSNQRNELELAASVLDGGRVDPDSGDRGYDGPQEASNPDPFFYRPDLDPPMHPGLLEEAQRPFDAVGLDARWLPVAGNHDVLVQGEVPATRQLDAIATGGRMLVELDRDLELPEGTDDLSPEVVDAALAKGLPGKTEPVPADGSRTHLGATGAVAGLLDAADLDEPSLDYSYDIGERVRVIALDLVDRAGGSEGVITAAGTDRLGAELEDAGGRSVIVVSHQPLESTRGADAALALLDRDPDVIATLAGHTHTNSIEPRVTEAGGYWEINTASLTDFPQQTRALRVVEAGSGELAIETWMIDTAPDPLADTARALAFLDQQGGRPQQDSGGPEDRNAVLFLPRPRG